MVWSGDKLTYNYQTEEGDFGPAKMILERHNSKPIV